MGVNLEELKSNIIENGNKEEPDLYNFWDDMTRIEDVVPDELFAPLMKTYIKRAARLAFAGCVCGRVIASFKECTVGELWEIHRFLDGQLGSGETMENCLDAEEAMCNFWIENKAIILVNAYKIRGKKRNVT